MFIKLFSDYFVYKYDNDNIIVRLSIILFE